MTLDTKTVTQPTPYNTLFRTYLTGSIQQSMERVQAVKYAIPDADRKQAWHVLSYALEVDALWEETRELLLALAPRMELMGFRFDWMPYLEQGVARGRACGDAHGVARLGLEIGLLWQRVGEYEKSKQWLGQAEAVFARHNDARHRALALNRLGDVAQQQGRLDEARQLATDAQQMVDESMPECAHSFYILGLVNFDQKRLVQAQRDLEKAVKIWTYTQNERPAALSLQNLGRIHMAQQEYGKAVDLLEDAALIFQSTGDVARHAAVRMNQGISWFVQKDFCQALACYRMAEQGFRQIMDKMHLAMINNNYGLLYLVQDQWKEAEPFFRASIAQWEELGNDSARINSMDGLGLSLAGQAQYEDASQIFQTALAGLPKVKQNERRKELREKLLLHLQEAQRGTSAAGQVVLSFD